MKPGDKVGMNNKYYGGAENKSRIWTVASEPWMCCGTLVVKLKGNLAAMLLMDWTLFPNETRLLYE